MRSRAAWPSSVVFPGASLASPGVQVVRMAFAFLSGSVRLSRLPRLLGPIRPDVLDGIRGRSPLLLLLVLLALLIQRMIFRMRRGGRRRVLLLMVRMAGLGRLRLLPAERDQNAGLGRHVRLKLVPRYGRRGVVAVSSVGFAAHPALFARPAIAQAGQGGDVLVARLVRPRDDLRGCG